MQKHRILSLASILAMLLIPALGWFLVAQPQLAAAAAADQQRADTEAQIAASAAVVAQLKADNENLDELNSDLNALRTSIPAVIDSSGYIDGLAALAKIAKVDITGLTVADAQAYSPATPANAVTVAPDAAAGEGTEGDGAETPTEPAAPPVEDPAIVTSPLIDGSNFVAVPVTVEVEGKWRQILKFVQGLQASPRLFLVTRVETTTEDDGGLKATVGGFIYAIPTGVPGDPKPISTTVKQMDSAEDADEETDADGADAGDDGSTEPTPDPTETPAP